MQTGYKCEISSLLEGSWGKPGLSWQGQGICSQRMWVCVRQTTTDWKTQRVAQQELFMAVQSPFYFFGTLTRTEVAVQYLWGSLDTCCGWKQGVHLLHRLYKWACCLWSSPVSHPGIQAKSNWNFTPCWNMGYQGEPEGSEHPSSEQLVSQEPQYLCTFHCLSSEIHTFTCHIILAWVDSQASSVLLCLRQQGAQRSQRHTHFHVSPATYHTGCHLCRQGRWPHCSRSCFRLLFSKVSRFPPV